MHMFVTLHEADVCCNLRLGLDTYHGLKVCDGRIGQTSCSLPDVPIVIATCAICLSWLLLAVLKYLELVGDGKTLRTTAQIVDDTG